MDNFPSWYWEDGQYVCKADEYDDAQLCEASCGAY